jgi:predicted amidophosphoribosyltransferase
MPITQWCWRCRRDVPMLDEREWQMVAPLAGADVESLGRLRRPQTNVFGYMALAKYKEITGHKETELNVLCHHRAALYGPPCEKCGKPLRTPRASFCAACGARARR